MRTMLIVFSLMAAGCAIDGAKASSDTPTAAPGYRTAAADTTVAANVAMARPSGPDCGLDRLSVIWGPDRQPGAYECFAHPKGF